MEWLNHHHLYYFWLISQEGGLTHAATKLRLTHSTLSEQLRSLEAFFGQELFDRRGRRLVLTQFGAEVAQYAADIFRLSHELVEMARGRARTRRSTFRIGTVGILPKTIVYRLLEPALNETIPPALEFYQGDLESLLAQLSRNMLHVILSDQPARMVSESRAHTHLLGETEILLYGADRLASRYRRGFPGCLEGAPMLFPAKGTSLRQSMNRWFTEKTIEVKNVGEFDDAGLLRTFGALGIGLFPVRSVLVDEIEETHHVHRIGALSGVREKYYVISQERRVRHPLVAAIIDAAKNRLLLPPKVGKPRSQSRRTRD